jgi:[calcium/calmodulin-dependent protein kinase] kinase
MESGSRTVGNSPSSSPGLFSASPATPPLRHTQLASDDHVFYSSPYLHHTQRQIPKETHVADLGLHPETGDKVVNQYHIIDELGRGVHGKVKLGQHIETKVYVAIKIVDRFSKRRRLGKNTSHEDKIRREIAILKKARHPNIVSLLEVIDDPTCKKVYIVLELVELGEVKWRTLGAKEVALVEWRRFQRDAVGELDNGNAELEDEQIITLARKKLEQQRQRRSRERSINAPKSSHFSAELGGQESGDEISESGQSVRAASSFEGRHGAFMLGQDNMDTAIRSSTPTAFSRQELPLAASIDLEGTMYGPYDTEPVRGRTPSLTGNSSFHGELDEYDEIPEHFRYVPLMTLAAARAAFRDTVLGLEYLHYQGIIHRDIKPANLLVTKEHRVKISDFGVSYLGRQSSQEPSGDQSESDAQDANETIELAKTVGTPAFYAPELCHTDIDADTPPVTNKIDVWALGVTLYCLVFGRVPFHDNNTFVLMRLISETEAHLPHFRLKAVDEQPPKRAGSHGSSYHSTTTTNKRAPHEFEYEEVDEELRDLLKRLLVKDPRRRISIAEIKRHPWLLQDIADKVAWVRDTDPTRVSQGGKIEVSKDDVEQAVVPITVIERIRSGVRKAMDTVVGRLGGGRGGSRRRAQSSATTPEQPQSLSSASSSTTISHSDGRRPSLGIINQSVYEALKLSRDQDHPLSQSVTASPETNERHQYFERIPSRPESPAERLESSEHLSALSGLTRPSQPERAHSTMSSAASIRTIRPSDVASSGPLSSPIQPPALPGTPTALDTPGGSNLGGIFGGGARRIVNSVRSRERMLTPPNGHTRTKSIDRLVTGDDDPHGGPSIALSNALATGRVDPPAVLKDLSPIVSHVPSSYERTPSRQSSISSASSPRSRAHAAHDEIEVSPLRTANAYPFPPILHQSSSERFGHRKDTYRKSRAPEESNSRETTHPMPSSRPPSSLSQPVRVPSPDDEVRIQRERLDDLFNQQHPSQTSSMDTDSVNYHAGINPLQLTGLISSSSEDHFTSISQSTSNPSIPSIVSATSSVAPDESISIGPPKKESAFEHQTHLPNNGACEDLAGYEPDHPFASDGDDDSEEELLVITKKKGSTHGSTRSGSGLNTDISRPHGRRDTLSSRRRSDRSGSNGTVKKIKPPGDSGIEEPKGKFSEPL